MLFWRYDTSIKRPLSIIKLSGEYLTMNKTEKRILILGSLDEFNQLVTAARAKGYRTYVCDGNIGPAKELADESFNIDVREIDQIAKVCRQEHIDYIVTSFSDRLFECMVKIAQKAQLPCYIKPAQLAYYRDKAVMKATLASLNIPTPKHLLLKKDDDSQVLSSLHFPVVTKPLDMYGSRGVFVLNSPDEVNQYFDQACATSSRQEIIIEEYNSGHEFNMMTWVLDGEIYVLSIADREKTTVNNHDIPYSSRNVYPSRLITSVHDDAKNILTRFIAKTKQLNGPLSMQFFYSPEKGIQVGEIAGRFFGYEHELLEYCSQLSIEQLLLSSLNDPYMTFPLEIKAALKNHSAFFKTVSAVLYFQARDGIIANQSKVLSPALQKHIKKLQLFYQIGDHIGPNDSQPYAARVYITANTHEAIDVLTKQIYAEMSITDEDGNELLFTNQISYYY